MTKDVRVRFASRRVPGTERRSGLPSDFVVWGMRGSHPPIQHIPGHYHARKLLTKWQSGG